MQGWDGVNFISPNPARARHPLARGRNYATIALAANPQRADAMLLRHTEPNANTVLGNLLQPMLGKSVARAQNTGVIIGQPLLQPDILITATDRAPVVIEAEYEPAVDVEQEARERLGLETAAEQRRIEAVIALRYPEEVRTAANLGTALRAARLDYCLFTVGKYSEPPEQRIKRIDRFPESGWLKGSIADLVDLIRMVSVPQLAVEAASGFLQRGIEWLAAILTDMDGTRPYIMPEIAQLLGMDNVPQTRRMAGAILANAMVFHERIAGMHRNIREVSRVAGPEVSNPHWETLNAWTAILKINYWPIFAIGKDILQQIPGDAAARILRGLNYTVGEVTATGVNNAHDLTGRVFQRLISDRKYLATYYTLPPAAALLARLAVAKLAGVDLADAEAIGNLRIGDFACGTGALLSGVYEQIATRHEQAGGDTDLLHPAMLERVLYGCDVMPSAVHITGSTLSGMAPAVKFDSSRQYTLAYGQQVDGETKIGSLELLQSSAVMTLFNTSDPAQRTGSVGEETATQVVADIPDAGFDLVIMNPPFTSNTKHRDAEGNVQCAAFAAFGAPAAVQEEMSNRLNRLARNSCYHGHSGLGSAFAAIADKKVRPGGVIALVLLATAMNGSSWAKFRRMIATQYTDVTIVSIAAAGRNMSFSSDTGVGECLVIARKLAPKEKPPGRAKFVSLFRRPPGFVGASEVSKAILAAAETRHLEDGPYGGVPLYCGNELMGELLDAPLGEHRRGWGIAGTRDFSVAQAAHSLTGGQLWLPAEPAGRELPVTSLGEAGGQRGFHHDLLVNPAHGGPFTLDPPSPTATYPALYNHSAEDERLMVCNPDSALRVSPGSEGRADEMWATASRAHLNLSFRFNSQPLTAAFTEEKTLGGTAWPNVGFADDRFDYAFTLWCNSTLGLLVFWWHSSRQQSGRGITTISAMPELPVLDLRSLTDAQLDTAREIFEEFRDKELLPAYLADADPNRALLDRMVMCDLLGFEDAVYQGVRRLSAKWCAEPSVNGGKARPQGPRPVV